MLSWRITETIINLEEKKMSRKPTHPGEVLLEDVIKPLDLTITKAAKSLIIINTVISRDKIKPFFRKGDM